MRNKLNFLLFIFLASGLQSAPQELNADEQWLLDRAMEVNKIYQKPYGDEPWLKQERMIGGKYYTVERNNHALAHALRKAFLVRDLVEDLREVPAGKSELAARLQKMSPEEAALLTKKLELAALYHRAGRENENSRSSGSQFEKERFDRNMRNGAQMFKAAAEKSGLFADEKEIEEYMQAYSRYELQEKRIPLGPTAKFVDQLLYTTHILDSRRVNAAWNDLHADPSIKPERIRKLSESMGFGKVDTPLARKLDDISARLLEATGDRDKFLDRVTYSDEFFLQAADPKRMILALIKANKQ